MQSAAREQAFQEGNAIGDPGGWRRLLDSLQRSGQEGASRSRFRSVLERCIATVVLLVTCPIIAMIALIVRLDSPGPALFRQPRLGRGGRIFPFLKFRTLCVNARQRFPHLYEYRYTTQQLEQLRFKVAEDPRVTRVGRWLRKTSLDELPNFWNVLAGDMALVGPRPEIPEMLPYYEGDALARFSVLPGVTGLAEVSGRGRLTFLDTVHYDLEYVRRRSIWLDLWILLRTACVIIRRDGAF